MADLLQTDREEVVASGGEASGGAMAAAGVQRACVALTGNDGPERVEAFGEVIDAFR